MNTNGEEDGLGKGGGGLLCLQDTIRQDLKNYYESNHFCI